jgi:hypothetical protein
MGCEAEVTGRKGRDSELPRQHGADEKDDGPFGEVQRANIESKWLGHTP